MERLLAINGWNVGFNKIRLTNMLRAEFGYSLAEAKSITDQVLENQKIRIPFNSDPSSADDVVKRLLAIGAKASIVDE